MTTSQPVLFVSHEGTRTGAPIMLLHFLRWLRDNSSVQPEIALLRDGPLVEEFAEVGPIHVLGEQVNWPQPTLTEAALAKAGAQRPSRALRSRRLRRLVRDVGRHEVVYLNSAASLRLLHHLPAPRVAISHVHELRSGLRWALHPEDVDLVEHRVDHFVVAADCVADNLVAEHAVPRDRISRVYEFVDMKAVVEPAGQDRTALCAQLGLDPDALIVGGSGFADWRKGIDLFVQVARALHEDRGDRGDVHFVWVGQRPGGVLDDDIDFDIRQAGLEGRVHFAGLQKNSFDWYRLFDVFALTSREDPYPLVGLETALLEVPMVCFDAGGMTELIARPRDEGLGEAGIVVPYIDVEAMARAIGELLDDPDRRHAVGRQAGAIVRRDHDVSVAAPQLLEVLERVTTREVR